MKHFTKKLALLLVLALLISTCLLTLSACDDEGDDDGNGGPAAPETVDSLNGMTPQQAYNALLTRINAATNVEITADQTIDMNMVAQGMTMQQTVLQEIVSKKNGDNMFVKMETETESAGDSSTEQLMEVWYVDGVCYSHMKGTGISEVKGKATIDLDEFAAQYGSSADDTFPEFDAALLQGLKFIKADGQYYVEFTVPGEMIDGLVGDMIEDSMGVDCDFENLKYKIFFNEQGDVTGFENEFTYHFDMISQGVTISTTATAKTVATVKLGTVGTITPPADANSYIDVTGQV